MNIIKSVRMAIAALLAVLVLGMAAGDNPAFAATVPSDIVNFTLEDLTLMVGDTVNWTNQDLSPHTTTSGSPSSPSGIWDSLFMGQGSSFSFTFNDPGVYPYFCTFHIDMLGTVTVMARPPVIVGKTALIRDKNGLSDSLTYSMADVMSPTQGSEYVGWLISDNGSVKLSTGPMAIAGDGTIRHTFDESNGRYTGENLITSYNQVVITEEAAGADPDAPAGPAVYSHEVPPDAMAHIRHLLTDWPPGSGAGILANLIEQLNVAGTHANLARNSTNLPALRNHTEHVVNAIEGPDGPNYGDLSGDGSTEDFGDGVGVLTHASDRKHAGFATGAAPNDQVIAAHAAKVEMYGTNAEDGATAARDLALGIFGEPNLADGLNTAASVMGALEGALNDLDGALAAYVEGQRMATYTLIPVAPVTPADPMCNGVPATMVGTPGPDVMIGTSGPDVIVGLGGRDYIDARGDDDTVCAGGGDDVVMGGRGDDWISGDGGNDLIRGGPGRDRVYGRRGNDTIVGGHGGDWLFGNAGHDTIDGRRGPDRLFGGWGDDILIGRLGNDRIGCGPGVDTANGGPGLDVARADCEATVRVP